MDILDTIYSVAVYYPDGTPVNGETDGTGGFKADGSSGTKIMVQWIQVIDGDDRLVFVPITLGVDGKAYNSSLFELAEGEAYHIVLSGLPEGYTYEDKYYVIEPGICVITLIAI